MIRDFTLGPEPETDRTERLERKVAELEREITSLRREIEDLRREVYSRPRPKWPPVTPYYTYSTCYSCGWAKNSYRCSNPLCLTNHGNYTGVSVSGAIQPRNNF